MEVRENLREKILYCTYVQYKFNLGLVNSVNVSFCLRVIVLLILAFCLKSNCNARLA